MNKNERNEKVSINAKKNNQTRFNSIGTSVSDRYQQNILPNSTLFNKIAGSMNRNLSSKRLRWEEDSKPDFKNLSSFAKYCSPISGCIQPRRSTGLSRKEQKIVEKAIKRAVYLLLIPQVS